MTTPPPTIPVKKCANPTCPRPAFCKGFCRPHYLRMRKGEDPMAETTVRRTGVVELGPLVTKVSPGYRAAFDYAKEDRNATMYELTRTIVEEWLELNYPGLAASLEPAAAEGEEAAS